MNAVTLFTDHAAVSFKTYNLGLEQLAALIRDTTADRDALPLVKLARFGSQRTKAGSLRHDANVISVTGVEGDYDAGEIGVDEALRRLSGIAAIIYTTRSHTPDHPRWRVLTPFSTELQPDARCAIADRLNGALGGILASESWVLSQAYFFGSVGARVEVSEGRWIDECDWIEGQGTPKRQPMWGWKDFSVAALDELACTYKLTVPFRSRENGYATSTLLERHRAISRMKPGGRGTALFVAAKVLGRMIARGWIEADWVIRSLEAAAGNCALVKKDGLGGVRREIYRGLVTGLAEPWPDLPTPKTPARGLSLSLGEPDPAEVA